MKVKCSFILFTFCMLFGILTNQVSGQIIQQDNRITGFVRSPERQSLSDMFIELYSSENNRPLDRVKTDSSGRFMFTGLSVGRFELRIITVGTNYEEERKEVEILRSSLSPSGSAGSDTVQANFNLRYKPGTAANAPSSNAVLFAQDIPDKAKKAYEAGISDLKDKKTDNGIAELKSAVEIYPKYYLALDRLGQEYIAQLKYQEAADVLAKAVEINPKGYNSQYALGYSLYQLKDYPHAVEVLKKAVEINPSSVNALFFLGMSFKYAGNYEESLANLLKAEKLASPPQQQIHWQLSLLYTNNLKKYDAAADELEVFLKVNPNYEEAEKVRGLIKTLRAKAKG